QRTKLLIIEDELTLSPPPEAVNGALLRLDAHVAGHLAELIGSGPRLVGLIGPTELTERSEDQLSTVGLDPPQVSVRVGHERGRPGFGASPGAEREDRRRPFRDPRR